MTIVDITLPAPRTWEGLYTDTGRRINVTEIVSKKAVFHHTEPTGPAYTITETIRDRWGRCLGAYAVLWEHTPPQGTQPLGGVFMSFSATRDEKPFGPCNPVKHFPSLAEGKAAIDEYFIRTERRYRRVFAWAKGKL